jgi:hypothetical protein
MENVPLITGAGSVNGRITRMEEEG